MGFENFNTKIIIYANETTIESIISELSRKYSEKDIKFHVEKSLSKREVEVLRLIADGKNNSEIAKILNIATHTAKAHVSNILKKLNVEDRVQAAVKAIKCNLI